MLRLAVLLVLCAAQAIARRAQHNGIAARHLRQQEQQQQEQGGDTLAATPAAVEMNTAEVTPVRTAAALFAAVLEGAEHIEIREHISLSVINVDPNFLRDPFRSTIKSIRVRC